MTAKKSRPSKADEQQWSAARLKDESTGDLSYDFTFPNGHGGMATMELGNELSFKQMVQRLRKRTTELPQTGAAEFVEALVKNAPPRVILKVKKPGWRPLGEGVSGTSFASNPVFVTPGQIVGPGRGDYRWFQPPGGRPHIGQIAGDSAGWHASLGAVALQSNYISFAIMAHLASPLLAYTDLPEDPIFNLVSETSVGKTTAIKAGGSTFGHPNAIRSWDMSERGLEEACADHNDLPLALNAAEKAPPKKLRGLLNRVVHMVAERESTVRSQAVQEQLPNLTWRTCVLSTANKTGAEMADELDVAWEPQDAARFIDVPVPSANEGGIFDRLGDVPDAAAAGAGLIAKLEEALPKNYGALLEPWIEYLLTVDARAEVARYIRRFLKKTGPHSALEARIAKKFALIYAAGRIALDAGLLKWPSGYPLAVTMTLLTRAKELRETADRGVTGALTTFAKAISDPTRVKPLTLGEKFVSVRDPGSFVGVRYTQGGKRLIGIRKEALPALVGDDLVPALLRRLDELGALKKGHGNKSTQQLAVTLRMGTETLRKPRFLVVDPGRLPG